MSRKGTPFNSSRFSLSLYLPSTAHTINQPVRSATSRSFSSFSSFFPVILPRCSTFLPARPLTRFFAMCNDLKERSRGARHSFEAGEKRVSHFCFLRFSFSFSFYVSFFFFYILHPPSLLFKGDRSRGEDQVKKRGEITGEE